MRGLWRGNGQRPQLVNRRLADFTDVHDPNAVVESAIQAGEYGLFTLQNHAIASGLPRLGHSRSVLCKDLFGDVAQNNILNRLLSAILLWTGDNDPVGTDVAIYGGFADNKIGSEVGGIGVRLVNNAGNWRVARLICAAGVWSVSASAAQTATDTVGARQYSTVTNTAGQRAVCTAAMTATGPNSNQATGPANASVGSVGTLPWFFIGCGWETGTGGTDGATVSIKAGEELLAFDQIVGWERPSLP